MREQAEQEEQQQAQGTPGYLPPNFTPSSTMSELTWWNIGCLEPGYKPLGLIWCSHFFNCWDINSESESFSVVSNSLWPHGLCSPWNSPAQNTGVGSSSLRQRIFPTQGSNPGLPYCRQILHQLTNGKSWLMGTPGWVISMNKINPCKNQWYVLFAFGSRDLKASLVAQMVKKSACNAGNPSSIPGLGSSSGEGIGYPLQYCWASLVTEMAKNTPACRRPGLNPWAGKILRRRAWQPPPVFLSGESPWTEKPGGLQSMWSHRAESDWAVSLAD